MKINRNILPYEHAEIVDFYIGRNISIPEYNSYSGDTICWYVGDETEHFSENRNELAINLDVSPFSIIQPHQTHGSRVAVISENFSSLDFAARAELLEGTDALITNLPNIVIGVNTADCVPVLFYAPSKSIIGVAHAGWRGTASRIVQNVVNEMMKLGASLSEIEAGIGVAISMENYEVGNEVVEALIGANIPIETCSMINSNTNKYHVDLREANRQILLQAGLKPENIKKNSDCTFANSNFYSARRDTINSGRNYTGIVLKK